MPTRCQKQPYYYHAIYKPHQSSSPPLHEKIVTLSYSISHKAMMSNFPQCNIPHSFKNLKRRTLSLLHGDRTILQNPWQAFTSNSIQGVLCAASLLGSYKAEAKAEVADARSLLCKFQLAVLKHRVTIMVKMVNVQCMQLTVGYCLRTVFSNIYVFA